MTEGPHCHRFRDRPDDSPSCPSRVPNEELNEEHAYHREKVQNIVAPAGIRSLLGKLYSLALALYKLKAYTRTL